MSYSKVFNPEKYEVISRVIESIQRLTPGEGIQVRNLDPEGKAKIRYLIYDYLYHMNLTKRFRLKVIGESLVVQRLGFRTSPEVVQFGTMKDNAKVERLIELWGTDEAEAALAEWVKVGELTAQEGEELWEHLKRIMS